MGLTGEEKGGRGGCVCECVTSWARHLLSTGGAWQGENAAREADLELMVLYDDATEAGKESLAFLEELNKSTTTPRRLRSN